MPAHQNKRIRYESHEYEIFRTTQYARHVCSNYNQDGRHDLHHEDIAQLLEYYDAADPKRNDRYTFLNWNNRRGVVYEIHVFLEKRRPEPPRPLRRCHRIPLQQAAIPGLSYPAIPMNKPPIPPMLPTPEGASPTAAPKAVVQQPGPASQAARAPIAPVRPRQHTVVAAPAPYVDPYLFETGYYAGRAEYEELSRTAPDRLQLRADVENARPRRKK